LTYCSRRRRSEAGSGPAGTGDLDPHREQLGVARRAAGVLVKSGAARHKEHLRRMSTFANAVAAHCR